MIFPGRETLLKKQKQDQQNGVSCKRVKNNQKQYPKSKFQNL